MLKQATKPQNEQHHTNTTHPSHQHDLFTVHELAVLLRVDDTTVRRWLKIGALRALELPHCGKRVGYRIRREDVEALFATSK